MKTAELRELIRDVPDWPEPGIVFKDITPLLADAGAFHHALDAVASPFDDAGITKVVGIEARGFIFAAPIADRLGAGFVPVRKPGKLPYDIHHQEYALEYGSDRVEVHTDGVHGADLVLVVDDVLATGGTGRAAIDLIRRFEAEVAGFAVLVELEFLAGREKVGDVAVHSVVRYGS